MKTRYYSLLISFFLFSICTEAQQIIVGSGTGLSVFSPICRNRDYSAYEIIYLSSDINASGVISDLAFQRADGENVDPIQNVSVFMKQTSDVQLSNTTYSEAGYQLVYQGSWPNDSGPGWREVPLTTPFNYDGLSNLQVLTVKGYEAAVANTPVTPRWYYTDITPAPNRARRYYGSVPIDSATAMTSINYSSNARLNFNSVGLREISDSPVSIYPNPAKDHLFIRFRDNTASENPVFEMYDVSGRLMYRETLSGDAEISLKTLSPGLYIYTLRKPDEQLSGKLLIQ